MPLVTAAALIILGALAASSFIIAKKPNARELLDKFVPFQGWIGFIVCLWGLWTIVDFLLHIGAISRAISILASLGSFYTGPSASSIWLGYITYLLTGVLEAVLGFLMGYGLISKLILSKNPEAQAKCQAVIDKLVKIQVPLGLVGMVFGIWSLIAWIILIPH